MKHTNEYQYFHRRKLPHIQPTESTIFVTFRLDLSMPQAYFDNIKLEERELLLKLKKSLPTAEYKIVLSKKLFALQDSYMDRLQHKDNYFLQSNCAKLILDELHFHNSKMYELFAYTIMPNHVHMLIKPLSDANEQIYSIAEIMKSIKGRSSRSINLELNGSGRLWLKE